MSNTIDKTLTAHIAQIQRCRRCKTMASRPVVGGAVASEVLLVGQAPGEHEPDAGKPFAWTAGKTLFGWFEEHCGISEETFRSTVYMAAVCRCFPGRNANGSDRTPSAKEVKTCARWLAAEFRLLRPALVIPVGRIAIRQLIPGETGKLVDIIGRQYRIEYADVETNAIPLPHPSGASPWHKTEPGQALLADALRLIARQVAWGAA